MASEICIPRLGWNMEEGVFLGWLCRDGESVRAGQPIFTLEGEKAAQDVEATEDGILWIDPNGPQTGAVVAVGAVIGAMLQTGEAPPTGFPAVAGVSTAIQIDAKKPPKAVAAELNPVHRVRERPRSSPLARRIARELNIDWTTLRGSGSSGRIRKVDVLAAVREGASKEAPSATVAPVSSTRRTIARRMVESRQATAAVTLTTTVDATNLVNLRGQFRVAESSRGHTPSYTDFLITLTAPVLREHSAINARWVNDQIEILDEVNIGVAVDTDSGLVVPVVRKADELSLRQVSQRSSDLIDRARKGALKANEIQGGTFTITNLGAFGIETFTPIINLPECAILGVGRIARTPVYVGERLEARDRLHMSLTFDHRITDGAPAARFLQELGRRIENPGPWLVS